MKLSLPIALLAALGAATAFAQENSKQTASLHLVVNNQIRKVVIELDPSKAPQTVANFETLVRNGFYKGLAVHRVIPKYLIQMGDPLTRDESQKNLWGTGGTDKTIPAEISLPQIRGSVAMARLPNAQNPSKASNGSQFFIALEDLPNLNQQYTVFGRVISGIEHLDYIADQTVDTNDVPIRRIAIAGVTLSTGGGDVSDSGFSVANVAEGAGNAVKGAGATVAGAGATVAGAIPNKLPDISMPKVKMPHLPRLGGNKNEEPEAAPAPEADPTELTVEESPAAAPEKNGPRMRIPFIGNKKQDAPEIESQEAAPPAPLTPTSAAPAQSRYGAPQPAFGPQSQTGAMSPSPEAAVAAETGEEPKVKEGKDGRQSLSLKPSSDPKAPEKKKGMFTKVIERVW